jgi:SSS family solute:Na+ symporter
VEDIVMSSTTFGVSALSLWVVAGIVLGFLAISLFRAFVNLRRDNDNTKQFFLMNQDVSGWVLTLTYCATLLSAFTFVGLPGFFYTHGIGTWLFVPFCNIAAVLIFYFFGRRFRQLQSEYNSLSPFEIIARAYDRPSLGLLAFAVSTVFILPHLAVQIAGIGKLAQGLGLDYTTATIALLIVFVIYTVAAGMWGDVITDIWQALVMVVGLWIICLALLGRWNFDLGALFNSVEEVRGDAVFSLPGPTGFFSHLSLLSYVIMFMSVTIVQAPYSMRIMIARGERELRSATLHIPWVLLLFFIPTLLIGLGGSALYPDLQSGDQVTGRVLAGLFGSGTLSALFLGVVLSAMVCAVISTVDSQLLALGATFARDVYRARINPDISDRAEIFISRVTMAVIAVTGFIIALNPPRLIVQLSILSVAGTLQLLPMFLGVTVLKRRPSSTSALISVIAGLLGFGVSHLLIPASALKGIPAGIIGLLVGTLAMIASEAVLSGARAAVLREPGQEPPA